MVRRAFVVTTSSRPKGKKMSDGLGLILVLQNLYAREINASIVSDWDDGFTVGLGNERDGIVTSEHFDVDELPRIPEWLERKAREIYPEAFG